MTMTSTCDNSELFMNAFLWSLLAC